MDTTTRILEAAEDLMQTHGYAGFSFQDLADRIGVRKPSLYHHFPAKADLGRAVIERYRTRMRAVADQLDAVDGIDARSALRLYLAPILDIGRAEGRACLCAVLGGEYLSLPEPMQKEVSAFFAEHVGFIERLLRRGRESGAFRFEVDAGRLARLVFAAIEGSMVIKRAADDAGLVDEVAGTIEALLGA
jgi:TetR/AcrR family transcriptional repressor of nem operon